MERGRPSQQTDESLILFAHSCYYSIQNIETGVAAGLYLRFGELAVALGILLRRKKLRLRFPTVSKKTCVPKDLY